MVLAYTEPKYYGRAMSTYMISWAVMPFVAFPKSAIADMIGVQRLVMGVGAILIVALLAIGVLVPGHRRLRAHEAPTVVADR
jgi:hypothetical protein